MYIVIKLDVLTDNIDILSIFDDNRDALTYLTEVVDKCEEISDVNTYRKIIDSCNQISIYKTHYIANKTLLFRYFIKEY